MLFIPKKAKLKYKKYRKGIKFNKIRIYKHVLKHGQVGLISLNHIRITPKQLTMLYNNIKKKMKKKGRIFMDLFPYIPVTKKPLSVRMGKGKGAFSFWSAHIRTGTTLCEISTPHIQLAIQVLKRIQVKLPIKTKVVQRIK